jgi:DNA-nicking Smr family endonuclease
MGQLRRKPAPRKDTQQKFEPFEIGQKASAAPPGHNVLPGLSERLSLQPVRMDRKAHARLKRGKLSPEARIDLHGMTMERAHPALIAFILRAQAEGKRAEDDGPIPRRPGALRHSVPQWLSLPPLAQAVLQVTEAHAKHGGGGAYYVYLRRPR